MAVQANSSDGNSGDGAEVIIGQFKSEQAKFRVTRLVGDLDHPWAVDWLPDGRMLITERKGTLFLVDGGQRTKLSGVPAVWAQNQGGLLDVAVAPDYEKTGWIYLTYSLREQDKGGTVVARARLEGSGLKDLQEIYRQTPFLKPSYHFGSRIAFLNDGTFLVTLGERGQRREKTVDIPTPSTSVGATVRLNMDGSVPQDNPFVGQPDVREEVYSYGHRNAQGMAVHPDTGAIWQHEHGPHGGDELNLIEAGNNYGWPAVSYGDTYSDQTPIGGTTAPGTTDPVKYWDPSPAFSGMAFYTGDKFPDWQGDLFLGTLAHQSVLRLELSKDNKVVHQEELLRQKIGRIRDVALGPDGYLYLLTDMSDGGLYRLEPVRDR
ncbi:PQQ-dependent sugar dehydrogenase [Bowmanella dokdonensis]|uniref:PQQ-dependent sugar dehydrogenase n=1 Tax=Bowmanella dokdonensis TaxID=751969 RepID=A0A939IRA8_9ALTE|nr:PQQ-dependent sugar dehydrogenase [Bowmanella dokdonensis]MBN7827760.1 PQQ-dependent sugar dehydrogenase [Bowmanella dokdonensis]